ncbi:MAG: NYN domain-containing protein [Anaerolineae bacterium]|nr:NYN domain-containing protein [Anaerolineae bacterium]
MALVIDGHNLIGALPDIQLDEPEDEARLLARLRAYRSLTGQEMIVFFDSSDLPIPAGRGAHLSSPGIAVYFPGPGQTADDAIVEYLRGRPQPGQYAVVTNDAELIRRVRALGADVMRASDLSRKLIRRDEAVPGVAAEPMPDPRDPAFADIYLGFLAAERGRTVERPPMSNNTAEFQSYVEELYGEDVEAAQRAARWLGRSGEKAALAALRDALTHDDVRVRAAALLALGDLGDRAAVPDLCDRLAHDSGSMAREAAAQSLGHIGDHAAIPALELAARSDPKSKVRKAALAALAQIKARK